MLKYTFYSAIFLSQLLFLGCATPYQGVKEPPNATWLGEYGTEDRLDTLDVNEGVRKEGDAVIKLEFSYKRTGLIKETVQTKTAYGNDLILKQGYKAYAMDFNVTQFRRVSAGVSTIKPGSDPIEWCVILEDGATGVEEQAELYCLLWVSSQEAFYQKSYSDYVYTPFFFGEANGMSGPVPGIQEQEIELESTPRKILKIRSISSKSVQLTWTETDGTYTKPSLKASAKTYYWDENNETIVSNQYANFKIKKINESEVNVIKL